MDVLFVTLDAGGNLPPALAIAREVVRRGGTARFLGHEPQRAAVERAGFRFETVREGRPYDAAAPRGTASGLRDLTAVFADRGIGADAIRLARAEPTDVVVVDCLLLGTIDVLVRAGLPTVSLVHTLWSYFQRAAHGPVGAILRLRGIRMRPVLRSPAMSLVTVRADFEPPAREAPPSSVRHVGPVLQDTPGAAEAAAGRPRILVSLSTTRFPGQDRALQRILDALDGLDAEAVVTTGPTIDPATLRAPGNATVHRQLDHGKILPGTSLVIGHGGHSTAARALAHGIPLLVLPMHPLMDQSAIGRAVVRHGAGRMLPKSAGAGAIRAAATELLADGPHRAAAARLGEEIRGRDGAVVAVDLLETLRPGDRLRPERRSDADR
ncbi:nucleotide disphospho-sugar-binding domain-containing protein [Dactylosporangium sp. NPDC000555]|uniref:glycosyltransferase n=1 Tax=Dactylosporangium sp. NPDC000555 TaxID=3154260 RepID=UPI00331EF59A